MATPTTRPSTRKIRRPRQERAAQAATPKQDAPAYERAIVQGRYEAIRDASKQGIVVVHFTKRTDGNERRMACCYDERAAAAMHHRYDTVAAETLVVWDTEKGALRTISLDAVHKVMSAGEQVYPEPGQDRMPETLEEADRMAAELFG